MPREWRIAENRWSALRDGVEATFKDLSSIAERPVRDILLERVETLTPVAERLGLRERAGARAAIDRAQRGDAPARGRARARRRLARGSLPGSGPCSDAPVSWVGSGNAIPSRREARHRPGPGPARRRGAAAAWRSAAGWARSSSSSCSRCSASTSPAAAADPMLLGSGRRPTSDLSATLPDRRGRQPARGLPDRRRRQLRAGVLERARWTATARRRRASSAGQTLDRLRRRDAPPSARSTARPTSSLHRPVASTTTCARASARSGGPFAEAYVIAHEYGHHVQHLLGTDREGRRRPRGRDVRLGAARAAGRLLRRRLGRERGRDRLHRGPHRRRTSRDGLDAAAAVGDDRIQQRVHRPRRSARAGRTAPSASRQKWFNTGYRAGDPRRCDTFAAGAL